jgi:LysM repeat protein
MNSMKTMIVMGLMAAAGYWMYMNVGQKPETSPGNAQAFISPPTVEIPGLNGAAPQMAGANSVSQANNPPALLGGGATTAGDKNVTMITPPMPSDKPNVSQGGAPSGAAPSLLSVAPTDQTPTAVYPPPQASSSQNSSPYTPAQPSTPTLDNDFQTKFAEFMQTVMKTLDEGRLGEAHLALSSLYGNPDLPQAQARQVQELLDQLAGTVVYSRQHLLEPPYIVRPGDTLDQIAQRYSVPAILLARINGIQDSQQLEPGRELKVVRGPFNAIIRLEKHELALIVDGRYAGRFAIGVGCDQPKLEGEYTVREKNVNPEYRGPDGVAVPGGDPRNPMGKFRIGLSETVALHGTVDPQNVGRDDNRGTICLGDRDIDDLYGILSVGSRVVIQR